MFIIKFSNSVEHKMIPFNRPPLGGHELQYITEALETGSLCGNGPFSQRCAARIQSDLGTPLALLTHSCTAALEMAAMLCDIGPGDEVILPSFTFVSTANAIALRGATPVFVDVDPLTLNVDPSAVADAVTPRTRAIFAVHYAGVPADMDALASIARDHDLVLVEDAAQAYGSTYKGRPCGTLGDLAAFSFHETKNFGSGEGGALTVNRAAFKDRAEILWEKGTNRRQFLEGLVDKYTWVDIGSSFLPGELIAAFLLAQLEAASDINARRLAIHARYAEAFADFAEEGSVTLPYCPEGSTHNGHMFYLILPTNEHRRAFIGHMRDAGIVTPFHYVPLHSAPAGLRLGRTSGSLAITDELSSRLVRLPLFADLGDGTDHVIDVARSSLRRLLRATTTGGSSRERGLATMSVNQE
jgi:dTDP-4-amino-4,6-dideoxygalactose transaminase